MSNDYLIIKNTKPPDNPKLRFNKRTFIKKVKELDLKNYKPARCGVIVYSTYNHYMFFLVGKDRNSGNITDFGGGVEREDKNIIVTALREFKEETLEIFSNITEEMVSDFIVVGDDKMMIIFVHIELGHDEIYQIDKEFKNRVNKLNYPPEVKDLVWFPLQTFKGIVTGFSSIPMYIRVLTLLHEVHSEHGNFFEKL